MYKDGTLKKILLEKKLKTKVIEQNRSSDLKKISNRKIRDTIYQRVWSWLRMNAGGVHNTFKSNEFNSSELS